MVDTDRTPDGGDAIHRPGDAPIRSLTFIVRVSQNEGGGFTGVVEHARTGRKERFTRLEAIGQLIASLLSRAERPDGDAKGS